MFQLRALVLQEQEWDMIYCREKLTDILLQSRNIELEELFDFDVKLAECLRRQVFTHSEWAAAEHFLVTGDDFDESVEKVIRHLAHELNYTDKYFLKDRGELAKVQYYNLEKGIRL
jgi:hypothetical protein